MIKLQQSNWFLHPGNNDQFRAQCSPQLLENWALISVISQAIPHPANMGHCSHVHCANTGVPGERVWYPQSVPLHPTNQEEPTLREKIFLGHWHDAHTSSQSVPSLRSSSLPLSNISSSLIFWSCPFQVWPSSWPVRHSPWITTDLCFWLSLKVDSQI